jgi:hypothetical protein
MPRCGSGASRSAIRGTYEIHATFRWNRLSEMQHTHSNKPRPYTNVGRDSNRSDFLRCRAPASGWLLDDEIEPSWTERMKSCSCARVRKRNESRAYGTPQALLSTAAFSDMSLISTTQQDRARVCVSPAQHTHLLRFTSMVRFAQHAKLLLMRKARNHYAVHCQLGHIGFTQLPELPMRIMHHGSFTAGQSSSAKYVS